MNKYWLFVFSCKRESEYIENVYKCLRLMNETQNMVISAEDDTLKVEKKIIITVQDCKIRGRHSIMSRM